ncbi:hypothetical protein E8E11_008583 [Didymella keratinophila]|nr:hypothetical protein E8E11_008583 [Didymella keratinophila]
MLFSNILLTGLASAAPTLTSRQVTTDYVPWGITAVSAARNGRPNSNSSATLRINIKQPNTIKLQRVPQGYAVLPAFEASCEFIWPKIEVLPVGETTCSTVGDTSTYGVFSMTVTGTSLNDFSVAIKEFREITVFQQQYIRAFETPFQHSSRIEMLVATLLFADIASTAPTVVSRQDHTTALAPWQITAASANGPSGRPGSSTTSGISITIKDPNTIPLRQGSHWHRRLSLY